MKIELINNTVDLKACEIIGAYADMSEAEWLKHRTTGLGGSDAGGVLLKDDGKPYSNYACPLSVFMDKTGRSKPEDLSWNKRVWMGTKKEKFLREMMVDYLIDFEGMEIDQSNIISPTHMYRSKENPFMIINVDGFIQIDGKLKGVEIKTGGHFTMKNWGGVDGNEIPDAYYCQVQHYMGGTGLDEFWVFADIDNLPVFRIVPRNDLFIADMIEKESALWELVKLNDPLYAPMPTGSDADMKALFELGNPQEDTTVDLSGLKETIKQYNEAGDLIKKLEAGKKQRQQEIIMAMGKSRYGESPNGYKVTYSRFEKSSFDKAKFMKDNPGMLDDYVSTSESHRLSIKSI